ncbi:MULTISPECIES: porin [unclassified Lonepinella]|uniref:porin n=1 Tax=unclassified Lonepinella TaxID=2642006 RepID=UPI0036DB14D8
MKKTLVALAVAATAATAVSTANAATVYEQNGTKIELSGSFRMFLGRLGDDQRGDLVNDGSRVILKASQDLGNGLSGLAGYELRFNDNADSKSTFNNPTTKYLYGGLNHQDVGTLTFGRQATNADDIIGDNGYFNSGALIPLTTSAKKEIKFRSAEWNGFSFGLDYLFGDSSKDRTSTGSTDDSLKNGYAATLFYNFAIDDNQALDFGAVYSQDNYDNGTTRDTVAKNRQWLVHAGYTVGPFNLGLNYGQSNYKVKADKSNDKGRYSLVQASYQVTEPSRVYVQWERLEAKEDNIQHQYLVGVDYKLHKNVITYVEYAHQRTKTYVANAEPTTEKDNVYGVGLRVYF